MIANGFFAQTNPPLFGGLDNNANSVFAINPSCFPFSTPDWINKYSKPSTYVPNANTPVITLKITLHVFTDNFGSGIWENTNSSYNGVPGLYAAMGTLTNGGVDRYSVARQSNYFVPNFVSQHIPDTRIQYEITNIYYYHNSSLYTNTNPSLHFSHINTFFPGRLDEGMPILIANNGWGFQTGYNGAPVVCTSVGP